LTDPSLAGDALEGTDLDPFGRMMTFASASHTLADMPIDDLLATTLAAKVRFVLPQCVRGSAAGSGGETVFCDTTQVFRDAPEELQGEMTIRYADPLDPAR